jgi:hypothetical protein
MNEQIISVDFFDVKRDFAGIVRGEKPNPLYSGTMHSDRLAHAVRDPEREDSWIGGSYADTVRFMEGGYKAPEFRAKGAYVRDSKKKRRTYRDDDGNLNLDRLYAGEEKFFEKREKRDVKPGVTVNVEYAFAAMVSHEDVRKYGAFVAGMISALEKKGFDLEVNVDSILDDLFQRDTPKTRTTVRCNVKKRGQKSRFHSYSCLFAPTGYRHVMFHAYHVAGAKIGKTPRGTLGMTIGGRQWGVEYDRKANVVTIRCNQRSSIDLDKLNADAKACGLL